LVDHHLYNSKRLVSRTAIPILLILHVQDIIDV
jgi:hypothetical protein